MQQLQFETGVNFFTEPLDVNIHEIGAVLGWDAKKPNQRGRIHDVIRELRLRLGELSADADDRLHGFTLPIRREPARDVPGGATYRYVLSANKESGEQWQGVRADTVLSRLEVDIAHYQSLASITDGRTRDGRVVRACLKQFKRLYEDLVDIKNEI